MGAAAGLPVEVLDLNGAQDTLALNLLSDARCGQLLRRAKPDADRPVLEDDLVGASPSLFELLHVNPRRGQINRGNLAAQMKRNGWPSEEFHKRR